ncbi:MAG TPA: pilus assembly protein TadG-related protein, partial [Actinomycetota bacterium]
MTILTTAVLFLAGVLVLVSLDLMRTLAAGARAQTAADAAALAAAQEIAVPTGTWSPQDAAAYYAER